MTEQKQFDNNFNLIEQFPGHLYWKNIHGITLGCNQNVLDFFGLTLQEYCGLTDYDLMDEAFADRLASTDKMVREQQRTIVTEEQGVDKNGHAVRYLSCKSPLRDKVGNIIGVVGTSLNIEDIKQKEKILWDKYCETELSFKRVINLMPGQVYWVNNKGEILGCNQNMLRFLGCEHERQVLGNKISDFIAVGIDGVGAQDQQIMQQQSMLVVEEKHHDAGAVSTYRSQKLPIHDCTGETTELLNVSINITNEKQAEQAVLLEKERAERLSQSKTELILNMSHDLRTPCANILGLAKMIQQKKGEDCEKQIDAIVSSSESLLILLEDLLQTESQHKNQEILSITQFLPEQVIYSAVDTIQADLMKKNIEMQLSVDDLQNIPLLGDKHKLYRILVNLLSNAVKFTEQGFVRLSVQTQLISREKAQLSISVMDSGLGITQEQFTLIFEKFHRVNPAYQGVYKGCGVGLFVVKQFVEVMQGQLSVESQLGKGSDFKIELPFLVANTDKRDSQFELEIFKTLKVLIVEDNAIARRLSLDIFSDLCASVDVAEDATTALGMPLSEYDLMVLDIGLPDMDGYALAKKIKRKLAHAAPMLLGLTAHATLISTNSQCIDALYAKPLTQDKARQMLQLLLS